jgi:hypothetical protein
MERRWQYVPILVLLMLAMSGIGFPIEGVYTLDRIQNAYDKGEISFDQYIEYTYYAGMKTDLLPAEYQGVALAPGPMDGTYFIIRVLTNKDKLSPETYNHLVNLFPTFNSGALTGCYMDYGGAEVHSYGTDHFVVWYATSGPHAVDPTDDNANGIPDAVEFTAADFEYARANAQSRGWLINAPQGFMPLDDWYSVQDYPELGHDWGSDPDQDPRLDVHMGNLQTWGMGAGVLGVTVFQMNDFPLTDRADCNAYFMMPQDYNTGGYATCETSCHEFHHSMQAVYDFACELGAWLEMSAVWNENATYPDSDEYISGRLPGFFNLPNVYLFSENGLDAYNHCIWAHFLDAFLHRGLTDPLPTDLDGVRATWEAQEKGDEWITGGSIPGSSSVDRRVWQAMGYYYYEDSEHPIFPYEDFSLDTEYFKEAFIQFTKWNWFTGDRDPNDEYYYEGHKYPKVKIAKSYDPVPDEGVDFTDISPTYKPDNLGATYIWATNFPSGWNKAVMKFLANRTDNPQGTEQWDGWLMTKVNGVWNSERLFCPWDNGIMQFDLTGLEEAALVVANKTWDESGKTYTDLDFNYAILPVTDTTPPQVSFAAVVLDQQPEYVQFAIAADEPCHGVPQILVDFTPADTQTVVHDNVFPIWPDETQPVYSALYSVPVGKYGDGVIHLKLSDTSGNISSQDRDFAAGVVPAGVAATLGNDQVDLFLPPGCTSKTSTILVIEEPMAPTVAASQESVANSLLSNGLTGVSELKAGGEQKVEFLGRAYRIEPGWMDLNGEAQLTMSYAGLDVSDESKVSIYRADGKGGWVEIGGEINPKYDRISAQIGSFGVYALGYGTKGTMGEGNGEQPGSFSLAQNYPNPFNAGTTIKYSLADVEKVSIKVYNLSGQLVKVLVDEVEQPGNFTLSWDGKDESGKQMASGVYIYQMNAGSFQSAKKMVLVR